MSAHPWGSAILAATLLAGPAIAGPLTYYDALARATASAPAIAAAGLRAEAAVKTAASAGRLPDPQLRLGVENYPVSGPGAGRFGADEMTMATVGVMQDFPNRTRRRAEVAGAQADVDGAAAQRAIAVREVRVATALAWIDLHYAKRRLSALDDVLAQLTPLWEAAPAMVASGAARPASGVAPVRLRAGLDDRRDALAADLARAQAEVTRWTGELFPTASGPGPDIDVSPERLRANLMTHVTLLAYDAEARRTSAAVSLAEAQKRPDLGVEVGYGRRDPMFGDMVSATVSVRLPIFADRRQDPLIAARRADVARVEIEREMARRTLSAALDAGLADHVMHHAQWMRARDVLIPAARQQADLETASYAAGRASLADVLQAFTDTAEAQLTLLEREAALARDAVYLTLTYGVDLP